MNGFADRGAGAAADVSRRLHGGAELADGAVLVALREVEINGGTGQVLDLPLFDPLFSMLGRRPPNHKLTGDVEGAQRHAARRMPPRAMSTRRRRPLGLLSASTQGMAERVLVRSAAGAGQGSRLSRPTSSG